jgi:hypothetical protein
MAAIEHVPMDISTQWQTRPRLVQPGLVRQQRVVVQVERHGLAAEDLPGPDTAAFVAAKRPARPHKKNP